MLLQGSASQNNIKSISDRNEFIQKQESIRDQYQMRHSGTYSSHFIPNAKINKDSAYLLGNQTRIYGIIDDDYNCNDTVLNLTENKSPNAIILGGLSINDMEYIRKGHLKYMYKPRIDPV